VKSILIRAFARRQGILGRFGGIIMARSNQEIATRMVEILDVHPNDRFLEIGYGPGVAIQLIAAKLSSCKVEGIDSSAEMMQQARARNAAAVDSGRIELRLGSVDAMPSGQHVRQSIGNQFNAGLARCRGRPARNLACAEAAW
jgi:SAM-dependent methyltransferase